MHKILYSNTMKCMLYCFVGPKLSDYAKHVLTCRHA